METNTSEVRVTQAVAAPAPSIAGTPVSTSNSGERLLPVGRSARRIKRTFRKVELGSLLRFSVAFFVCLASVWTLAAMGLFMVAQGAGMVANLQSLMRDIGWPEFRMTYWTVFEGALVGGIAVAALLIGATMLTAFLYNLISEVIGGVEVTVTEDEVG